MTAAETDLWQRWKTRGDRDAFRRLVTAHEAFVHDFARRLCGHDADAEDIAQEAFLELAEAPLERPLKVGLRAFLGRRIVLAAKTLRRAALSRRTKEAQAPLPVQRSAAHAEAEEALALLDTEERDAVTLRFLHGLSYAEVADVLGVSEGAARVRVHRALGRLRTRLGPRAEQAIAALPLFLPAKTFSQATTGAAALGRGAVLMTASANRYLVVALVFLLLVGGVVATRVLPSRAPAREVTRAPDRLSAAATGDADERSAAATGGAGAPGSPAAQAHPVVAQEQAAGAARTSIAGRLRFTDGTPVRGMRLRIGAHLDEATTDEEGRFTFDRPSPPLPNKLYQVGPDDYVVSIATVDGDSRDIVIERGLTLQGNVAIERTGEPVAGALLELTRPGAVASRTVQAAWGKAKTDAEGRFAFEHALPATYDLLVTAKGIEPRKATVDLFEGSLPAEILVRPARPMTVRFASLPDGMVGRKITLGIWAKGGADFDVWYWDLEIDAAGEVHAEAPPPGRYGLRVFGERGDPMPPVRVKDAEFESVTGEPVVVVLESEAGRAGIEGTLFLPDGRPGSNCCLRLRGLNAHTDGVGRFTFADVPAGEQQLIVRVSSTDLYREKLEVPAQGRVRHDVYLTGTGVIVGRFTSAKDPVNAHVALSRRSDRKVVALVSFGYGGDGRFKIPFLEPGGYELVAFVGKKGSTKRDVEVANDTVDIGDIAIDPTPEVPVVATVPAGVKAAGDIKVHGKSADHEAWGWLALDDDGHGFLRGLAPGHYRLAFTVQGCAPLEVDAVIEAEPSQPITFTLVPE